MDKNIKLNKNLKKYEIVFTGTAKIKAASRKEKKLYTWVSYGTVDVI